MIRLRAASLLVSCFVLALLLPLGAANRGTRPWFFLVLTDPQLGMYDQDKDFNRESENLERLVEFANRTRPAFIVDLGDSVNKAGDERETRQFRAILSKLDTGIPVYNVPGNHDVRNHPTPESLAAYRAEFGSDRYTFEHHGFKGIVLNSSLLKYPELADKEATEQSAWLERTLNEAEKTPDKEIVVFQHIPWFLHQVDEADNYSNMPRTERNEYLNRFEKAHIRYIFAGHLHENAFGTYHRIQMRTVSALGKPLGKSDSGFGVVVVDEHELKFTYYPISDLPAGIPLQ